MNPMQNPLFKEPVGMTFKIRREQLGMSIDDVSKSLKFGAHLVQAIELEQWDNLGPSIYANSYINSYIKLLDLNSEIRNEIPRFKSDPVLKTIVTPRLAASTSLPKAILAIFIVSGIAAIIAFLYSSNQPALELSPSNAISIGAEIPNAVMIAKNPITQAQTVTKVVPLTNEVVALPISSITASTKKISVHALQEINLEIRDSQDAILIDERIPANQDRTHDINNAGKITLDNAVNVVISINGETQDLVPFITNGVARFTVDENGNLVAISQ